MTVLARGEATLLISDPLFRQGYDDCWRGLDRSVQQGWDRAERRAYGLGYDFALWLQNERAGRVPLTRGGLPTGQALAGLIHANASGALSEVVA